MELSRPNESRTSQSLMELQRLRSASFVLSSSSEVADDYQLGLIYDVLTNNHLTEYQFALHAIETAENLIDETYTKNYLSSAKSALLDDWHARADEDAQDLTEYLAGRYGLIQDLGRGVIKEFVVIYEDRDEPQVWPSVNDQAIDPSRLGFAFYPEMLLEPEATALLLHELAE